MLFASICAMAEEGEVNQEIACPIQMSKNPYHVTWHVRILIEEWNFQSTYTNDDDKIVDRFEFFFSAAKC